MSPTTPRDSSQHRESAQRIEALAELDAVVTELEAVEMQQRRLAAARVRLLSAALQIAVTDQRSGNSDLRYRALRAELATALSRSEPAIEAEINTASQLTRAFPSTLTALEHGGIALDHARV